MNIQIKNEVPQFDHWRSPRDKQIFEYCAVSGEVWAGYVDDTLVACWGIIPPSFLAEEAYLWMLDLPVRHPIILARYSREVISTLLERWSAIHGHCLAETEDSCRWLRWLGAEFGTPEKGFVPFTIRRC